MKLRLFSSLVFSVVVVSSACGAFAERAFGVDPAAVARAALEAIEALKATQSGRATIEAARLAEQGLHLRQSGVAMSDAQQEALRLFESAQGGHSMQELAAIRRGFAADRDRRELRAADPDTARLDSYSKDAEIRRLSNAAERRVAERERAARMTYLRGELDKARPSSLRRGGLFASAADSAFTMDRLVKLDTVVHGGGGVEALSKFLLSSDGEILQEAFKLTEGELRSLAQAIIDARLVQGDMPFLTEAVSKWLQGRFKSIADTGGMNVKLRMSRHGNLSTREIQSLEKGLQDVGIKGARLRFLPNGNEVEFSIPISNGREASIVLNSFVDGKLMNNAKIVRVEPLGVAHEVTLAAEASARAQTRLDELARRAREMASRVDNVTSVTSDVARKTSAARAPADLGARPPAPVRGARSVD